MKLNKDSCKDNNSNKKKIQLKKNDFLSFFNYNLLHKYYIKK